MKLFLAGTYSRPWLFEKHKPLYVLESFFYIQDWQIKQLKTWNMFLLDSGAFTFMNNQHKGSKIDFNDYLTKYIKFINKYDIKYFFELDIDVVVGYEEVKRLRAKLEKETNKKCIPVWHKSRGLEEWINLTKEYDYVAIGGFVIKEIKQSDYKFIPKLLQIAKQNNCKVHGLGFTNKIAYKLDFFSVDSTNWLKSSRFGDMEYFNGKEIKIVKTPKGKKPVYYKIRDEFIIQEYIKFQKYLDKGGGVL